MSIPRTLSIGGATLDLFVETDPGLTHIEVGSKIPLHQVRERSGGGACNTAVGLKRLGCDASFAGVIGDDAWGTALLKNLNTEGVEVGAMSIVENEHSSFSMIITMENGERTIFYTSGTNRHLSDATFDRELAAGMDWVYLNHLHELSCTIEDDMALILAAVHGPKLTWNPGGCQISRGMHDTDNRALLLETDLLLLNKEEAMAFTETQSTEAALSCLVTAGPRMIAVTDGSHGTIATDGRNLYKCPVIADAKIIDTTGAGDAFGSGATWALLNGMDLPNALRAGTINATSVIGAIGAETALLTDIEMQHQLKTVQLIVEVLPFSPVS